jgi:hypothetical protein
MKFDKNKVGTELQRDVALGKGKRLLSRESCGSYLPSRSVRHTFEPHRMRYIAHLSLPIVASFDLGSDKETGGRTPNGFPAKLGLSSSSTLA